MNLYMWLAKKRISKVDFAKAMGISRVHVHRLINQIEVSEDLAIRVEEYTRGEVTRYDIKPELKKSKKKKKGPKMKQLDAFE